jgi:hypothetical protein
MSTTRRFTCEDLFKFNNVNLDVLTETVRAKVMYSLVLDFFGSNSHISLRTLCCLRS